MQDVATDLGIEPVEFPEFEEALKTLADDRIIEINQAGFVQLPSVSSRGGYVTGSFRKNARGFGFLIPAEPIREGDIFIAPDNVGDALTGDIVKAKVFKEGNRFAGAIVDVIKRKRSSFTGEITKKPYFGAATGGRAGFTSGNVWMVYPDGRELTEPIIVKDADSKNVKEGDKVVVEITTYPMDGQLAEGVVTRVLGDAGRPDVETQAVIATYDLPGEFPEECVEQAREASADFDRQIAAWKEKGESTLTNRMDLTKEFILTIDPPDAKDYDDAISLKKTDEGWELAVHIADVAHFIPPGSPLDEISKDRCNSCYLPRLVIPMLPEVLSNGICSLQEQVPRFCKTAFIRYNKRGEVISEGCANTLIFSSKRLTYLEAQHLIDGDIEGARPHAKTPPKYTDQLLSTLAEMNTLAKLIQARRHKQGMIVLDLPEVELVFDQNGRVIDAHKEDDAFTHKLIEMFMVEANEVLARLFEKLHVPLLRRIHPEPTPGDTDEVRKTAMVAGFKIPKSPTRTELQGLLLATKGTPAARAVHMAVLRTLTRAEYSPALVGHYALASEAYAHFTSPIRRYADLTVHRALAAYLKRTRNGQTRPATDSERKALGRELLRDDACPDEGELVEIGRHAGMREDNAESAERDLRGFLVLQLLSDHIGEVYSAVVTGISPRGLFLQIDKYLADGFIKAEDLPGDVTRDNLLPIWKVDAKSGALVDIRSGRSFNFGDRVQAKIASVDLAKRQLELVLDDVAGRAAGKAKKAFTPEDMRRLAAGGIGGGMGKTQGAGFGNLGGGGGGRTGGQRRSQKSKARDKGKGNRFRDK
jgi:ribonuclease R